MLLASESPKEKAERTAKQLAFYDRCISEPLNITPDELREGLPLLNYRQLHKIFESVAEKARQAGSIVVGRNREWLDLAKKISDYIKESTNFQ